MSPGGVFVVIFDVSKPMWFLNETSFIVVLPCVCVHFEYRVVLLDFNSQVNRIYLLFVFSFVLCVYFTWVSVYILAVTKVVLLNVSILLNDYLNKPISFPNVFGVYNRLFICSALSRIWHPNTNKICNIIKHYGILIFGNIKLFVGIYCNF